MYIKFIKFNYFFFTELIKGYIKINTFLSWIVLDFFIGNTFVFIFMIHICTFTHISEIKYVGV